MYSDGFKYKVVVIGDEKVGKTSLIRRFVEGRFLESYISTIGVDIYTKHVNSNQRKNTLVIWDFGGQKIYDALRRNFYHEADAAVLAYDTTNKESFYSLYKWLDESDEVMGYRIPIILIGTKVDLEDFKVKNEEGIKFAKENNLDFVETSSKVDKGQNVNLVFQRLTHLCMREIKNYQNLVDTELTPLVQGECRLCDISLMVSQ